MPRQLRKKTQTGFTYLELVIVILIISGLLYFAIDRLLKLQVVAERTSVEQMIGQLQSTIALTIAEHIVHHDIKGLRKYVSTNPMNLLSDTPINYLGSFTRKPEPIEHSSWWYDKTRHILVYEVANSSYFQSNDTEKSVIKLKLLPVYDDKNDNRRFDRRDVLKGLKLKPQYTYKWLNEPIDESDYSARLNNKVK